MKTIWRILRRLICSVLSTLLLLSLLLLPLCSFVANITDPDCLTDLIFSIGSLYTGNLPSSGMPKALLSGTPMVTGNDSPLPDELKDLLGNGTLTAKEACDTLKEMRNAGHLGDASLSFALQELVSAEVLSIGDVANEFGVSFAIQVLVCSMEGSLNFEALTKAFDELAGNNLLDLDALAAELDLPAGAVIDTDTLAKKLATSDAAQALISSYAEDVLNAATGADKAPLLTKDTVMDILAPHTEEIAVIVEGCLPNDVQIDRTTLNSAIHTAAAATLPTLVESLPTGAEMADTIIPKKTPAFTVAMDILKFIRSDHMLYFAGGIVIALALLIIFLQLPGAAGLRWVGTDLLTAGVVSGIMGYAVQTELVQSLLASFVEGSRTVFASLIPVFSGAFMPYLVIYGAAGVVLLICSSILSLFSRERD